MKDRTSTTGTRIRRTRAGLLVLARMIAQPATARRNPIMVREM
jgi:hypothetical protein